MEPRGHPNPRESKSSNSLNIKLGNPLASDENGLCPIQRGTAPLQSLAFSLGWIYIWGPGDIYDRYGTEKSESKP